MGHHTSKSVTKPKTMSHIQHTPKHSQIDSTRTTVTRTISNVSLPTISGTDHEVSYTAPSAVLHDCTVNHIDINVPEPILKPVQPQPSKYFGPKVKLDGHAIAYRMYLEKIHKINRNMPKQRSSVSKPYTEHGRLCDLRRSRSLSVSPDLQLRAVII